MTQKYNLNKALLASKRHGTVLSNMGKIKHFKCQGISKKLFPLLSILQSAFLIILNSFNLSKFILHSL